MRRVIYKCNLSSGLMASSSHPSNADMLVKTITCMNGDLMITCHMGTDSSTAQVQMLLQTCTRISDIIGSGGVDLSQDEAWQSSWFSHSGSSAGISGQINRVSAREQPSQLLYTPCSHKEKVEE